MSVTIKDIYLIVLSLALLFATIGLTPHRPAENVKVHSHPQRSHSSEELKFSTAKKKLISSSDFQQFYIKNQV